VVLKTGARRRDLPDIYPSPSTCWRRLKLWEDMGICLDICQTLPAKLYEKQYLDWEETFAAGSFAPLKKGCLRRENQARQRYEVDGGGRR